MRWFLWPVLVLALGSVAFHDECDNESDNESCALSALQRRAHATSGGGCEENIVDSFW